MIYYVIERKINLYDQKYYYPKNTHALYWKLKEDNKMDLLKPYMTQILNENTIYKLIFDLTVFSTGDIYSYEIEQETLEAFTTEEEIDTLIKKIPPVEDHEKFLVKVYETYKEHGRDKGLGEGVVQVSKELDIKSQLLKS